MSVRRLISATLLGIVFGAWIGTIVLQHLIPSSSQIIKKTAISHNGGYSYGVPADLPPRWPLLFEVQTDAGGLSRAILTEDGKPLVSPHALHQAILEQGNGRYSHWGTPKESAFIFSTSDNSDPRTNGRKYEAIARPGPSMFGVSLVLALPFLALLLQRLFFPASRTIYGIATVVPVVNPMGLTTEAESRSLSLV